LKENAGRGNEETLPDMWYFVLETRNFPSACVYRSGISPPQEFHYQRFDE